MTLVLAACAGGSDTKDKDSRTKEKEENVDKEGEEGGDLFLAILSDASPLNPVGSNDVPSSFVQANIFETLVDRDDDYGMYALFHSSQKKDPGNRSFYENADVDKLLETDPDARLEIYNDFQEYLIENAPMIFIHHKEYLVGLSDDQLQNDKFVKHFFGWPLDYMFSGLFN